MIAIIMALQNFFYMVDVHKKIQVFEPLNARRRLT